MLQLKVLSSDSIQNAISRAEHYRLLNEPWQAESICRDILIQDPSHKKALLNLLLSLTDQFGEPNSSESEARELCAKMETEYDRKYYSGLIEERIGKAAITRATPRAKYIAYEFYNKAMQFYEEAEKIHPEGNEDSVLRWNACLRIIQEMKLEPSQQEQVPQPFLE
jgi:hypothetical protein